MRISNIPVLVILKDRNFQFLWAARWIHEISRRMELIVLGYLILELTGSTAGASWWGRTSSICLSRHSC